jgi:Domain of unknown function (DUF4190)
MQEQRKGMAMAAMIIGMLGVPTGGCMLVGGVLAIALGSTAYKRAGREPAVYGGKGMALAGMILGWAGFITLPFLGTLAAIAIPSARRARIAANEASAIGDVRTVVSAESAYQSANNGYYGTLECLGAPSKCLPTYTGSALLEGTLAADEGVRHGYRHALHPGPAAASSSNVGSYAFVAQPVTRGQSGLRAFCGDDSGRVCVWPDGQPTQITDGRCPADCRTLD